MLRASCALFGTIFLPVGISFFFVLRHRHWMDGVGCVAAAVGFYYVAWRAPDMLGMDEIRNTADIVLPDLPPITRSPEPPEPNPSDQAPQP